MGGFVVRKNTRFKDSAPVQYRGKGIAGEGTMKDLSLTGGAIAGTVPVSVGAVLTLNVGVPDEPGAMVVEQATVQWSKGGEFGLELTPQRQIAVRVTQLIATLVQNEQRDVRFA